MTDAQLAKIWYCAAGVARRESGFEDLTGWDDLSSEQHLQFTAMVTFRRANQDKPAGFAHDTWVKAQTEAGWVRADCYDKYRKWDDRLKPFSETPADYRQDMRLLAGIVFALCQQN